ncbi:MAG: protein-export chaperone SecB [Steroidobacteraceae bacterium]
MAIETLDGAPVATGPEDPSAPQLSLQAVYLKDCSYEAPHGPRIDGAWNPQVSLDLHTSVNALSTELREVVLTVTVSAKQNDVTLFLVEVKQAGAFVMRNLSEDGVRRAVGSVCPGLLFPYVRATVSQLVTLGGFPQFLLPPVNFEALYTQSVAGPQPGVTRN